jgi:Ca2+-binding RTX toxin-like protein
VRADQSNFDAGGALQGTPLSAINTVDPDDNVNNDDNANPVAGNGVVTLPITLGYNTEPTAGVGNDTNFTLDIGVQANVVTITGSARADTINATTTVAGQPLPTGADDFITGGKGKDTIEALGGNDFIDGGRDADRLEGGAGTDVLVGGEGDDTFVFKQGFGNDFINDLEEGKKKVDVIEIHDNIFADFADVLAHSTQSGTNVVITADGVNSITLVDVVLANLNANDFQFV